MIRCFCRWQKRCAFGAMCDVGTLRNYFCHCEAPLCGTVAISRKGHNVEKQIKTDAGLRPSCAT